MKRFKPIKRFEPFNIIKEDWKMSHIRFENYDDAIAYALDHGFEYIYDNISDTWDYVYDIQSNF